MRSRSRGTRCPSLAEACRPQIGKAQGRPGAGWRPWSACNKKARGRTTGAAEFARPSLRDGFNAYTCSPRGPALLPPSSTRSPMNSADLTPAPGCQDHTISPSAPRRSSACENTLRHVASIAPRLACRDDRDTPLLPRRDVAHETTDLGSKSRIILIIGTLMYGALAEWRGGAAAGQDRCKAFSNFRLLETRSEYSRFRA